MNDLLCDVVIVKEFVRGALSTKAAADIDVMNFMIADMFEDGMYKYWIVNLVIYYAISKEFGQILLFFLPLLCCTLACILQSAHTVHQHYRTSCMAGSWRTCFVLHVDKEEIKNSRPRGYFNDASNEHYDTTNTPNPVLSWD
jgi:hypothetical protein